MTRHYTKGISIGMGIFIATLLLIAFVGFVTYRLLQTFSPSTLLQSPIVSRVLEETLGQKAGSYAPLFSSFAGFEKPVTYLFLFQNNTELRPSGGFIGVYGVGQVKHASFDVIKVEGTELLDARTPATFKPAPPAVLAEDLGVRQWFFRDSNWSPDFRVSAQKALELYKGEGGVSADDIDIVVGMTPTVLERLLAISGPITVDGITFTPENVTEKLEYEVEYGYVDKDIEKSERKDIVQDMLHVLVPALQDKIIKDPQLLFSLADDMVKEKQLVAYAVDPALQTKIETAGLAGAVRIGENDSLLWVDANLAALKTDHALDRSLSYTITPRPDGRFEAVTTMTYTHNGTFDWRTSRYLSYTRIYVPDGSLYLSTSGTLATPGVPDTGVDLGKRWFGTNIRLEPGTDGTLSFRYLLPQRITDQVRAGRYILDAQKQAGTEAHGLTLDLDFGTTIRTAQPGEEHKEWGNTRYTVGTDLRVDRVFEVAF